MIRLGRIDVITGPMFAGKTTELLRRVERYERVGKKCVVVKWRGDTRYTADKVVTHDSRAKNALAVSEVKEILHTRTFQESDVVGIDEGQFYEDIADVAWDMASSMGKIVIVSCLDGDWRQEPFMNVCRLLSKADTIVKLFSICARCSQDAAFTTRTIDCSDKIVVGGADVYQPVCRACLKS